MKFNELAKKAQKIKAPEMDIDIHSNKLKSNKMYTIIDILKKSDSKARVSIRALQIFFIVIIFLFITFLLNIDTSSYKYGSIFIIIAFIWGVLVQQNKFQRFNKTYANVPTKKFLFEAQNRMKFFNKYWYNLPIWISFDIGLCFFAIGLFPIQENIFFLIILTQIFLIFVIGLDTLSSYITWKKKYKPIIADVNSMLAKFEKNESTE